MNLRYEVEQLRHNAIENKIELSQLVSDRDKDGGIIDQLKINIESLQSEIKGLRRVLNGYKIYTKKQILVSESGEILVYHLPKDGSKKLVLT